MFDSNKIQIGSEITFQNWSGEKRTGRVTRFIDGGSYEVQTKFATVMVDPDEIVEVVKYAEGGSINVPEIKIGSNITFVAGFSQEKRSGTVTNVIAPGMYEVTASFGKVLVESDEIISVEKYERGGGIDKVQSTFQYSNYAIDFFKKNGKMNSNISIENLLNRNFKIYPTTKKWDDQQELKEEILEQIKSPFYGHILNYSFLDISEGFVQSEEEKREIINFFWEELIPSLTSDINRTLNDYFYFENEYMGKSYEVLELKNILARNIVLFPYVTSKIKKSKTLSNSAKSAWYNFDKQKTKYAEGGSIKDMPKVHLQNQMCKDGFTLSGDYYIMSESKDFKGNTYYIVLDPESKRRHECYIPQSIILKSKHSFGEGGSIEMQNYEMVKNNNKAIAHHSKELDSVLVKNKKVPAWVVAKVYSASTDLSDVTHYLDGAKFEDGGKIGEYEGTKYLSWDFDNKGNKWVITVYWGRFNYISILKKTNNPFGGRMGKDFRSIDEAIANYKDPNIQANIIFAVDEAKKNGMPNQFAKGGGVEYPDLSLQKDPVINEKSNKFSEKKNDVPEIDIVFKKAVEFDSYPKIVSSSSAEQVFRKFWDSKRINIQEAFYVMFLNNNNNVISIYAPFKGGITSTVADVEMICATAIKSLARGVIICHNHPSGTLKFSDADINLTKQLSTALKLVNIDLLDSLVITENNYTSMTDEGIDFSPKKL